MQTTTMGLTEKHGRRGTEVYGPAEAVQAWARDRRVYADSPMGRAYFAQVREWTDAEGVAHAALYQASSCD